mmetsp:Transcript_6115/g.9747  ORF Transcript_6115/g.9747 Transcript_6115/m.9747 type:complete len:202 (+) Transcript_6115:75-680(+)
MSLRFVGLVLVTLQVAGAFNPSIPQSISSKFSSSTPHHRASKGWTMSSGAPSKTHSRREVLAGAAVAALLAPELASADSTGKFSSKRTAKNRYVPRIKKGIEAFAAVEAGTGSVEAFLEIEEDMVGAMKLYGQAQKRNEVPDKISMRLEKDADVFGEASKKLAKGGDIAEARALLDKYFEHLPKDGKDPFGSGYVADIEKK